MPLTRDQITVPELTMHEEPCALLGGSVLVRVLSLEDRLASSARRSQERTAQARPDESEDEAKARADAVVTLRTVAAAVVGPDGQPLLSAEEWGRIAASNDRAFLAFSDRVMTLALGSPEAAAKN